MAENLSDAHHRDVFCSNDLLLLLAGHLRTAEADEGGIRKAGPESADELRPVGIAGGFACGEKNARVGDQSDESSLSLSDLRPAR
jgi:hypothetical protein